MPALDQQTLDAIRSHQDAIIEAWLTNLTAGAQDSRSSMRELAPQVREFWKLLIDAMGTTDVGNLQGREWADTRNFLEDFSRDRVQKGFSSSETANLIFSLKRPLFERVHATYGNAPEQLGRELLTVSDLLDTLGLHTVKAYQQTREEVIQRQQEEMLELSTPVVKLWEGVLALPMIGTLDSQRTQVVMESLLQRIVEPGRRPSLDGGRAAARAETASGVSIVTLPASIASNRRSSVISLVVEAGWRRPSASSA